MLNNESDTYEPIPISPSPSKNDKIIENINNDNFNDKNLIIQNNQFTPIADSKKLFNKERSEEVEEKDYIENEDDEETETELDEQEERERENINQQILNIIKESKEIENYNDVKMEIDNIDKKNDIINNYDDNNNNHNNSDNNNNNNNNNNNENNESDFNIDGKTNDHFQLTKRYIEDLNDFVKIEPPYVSIDDFEEEEKKGLLDSPNSNTTTTSTTTTTTTTTTTEEKSTVTNFFSKAANTFSYINNFIKYSIISEETEEALGHVNSLLNQLFKDVKYSKLQIMLGLSLLDSYYSNSHITTGSFVQDVTFIDKASYYMRFASATFGWKYVYGYLYSKKAKGVAQGVAQGDQLNEQILCEYTGIAKEDIILTKWISTNYDPGHFMCFDHKNKSVVLSIRGTFSARDVLTDLVANQTPFLDGKAHTGMLRCAQKKFNELTPIILESLKKQKEQYGVIIVGHSLGAGVASLFSILFKNSYPEIPIHCYSFATPCVTSSEIALSIEYRSLIDTFVFNDDIVPRLCYASLEHLKTLVCSILEQNDSVFNLILQTISAGNQLGEGLTQKMESFLKYKRDIKLKYEELKLTDQSMLPPGKVYRIYKPGENISYVMEESNPSFFKEIIISNTLISDHMPDKYEMGFQLCIENLNSINPFANIEKQDDIVILNNNDEFEKDIEQQVDKSLKEFESEVLKEKKEKEKELEYKNPDKITIIKSNETNDEKQQTTIPLTTTTTVENNNNNNNIDKTQQENKESFLEKIWSNNLFQ